MVITVSGCPVRAVQVLKTVSPLSWLVCTVDSIWKPGLLARNELIQLLNDSLPVIGCSDHGDVIFASGARKRSNDSRSSPFHAPETYFRTHAEAISLSTIAFAFCWSRPLRFQFDQGSSTIRPFTNLKTARPEKVIFSPVAG